MSEPLSIAAPLSPPAGGQGVRAAIARAAAKTGVDFDYLLAQAKIESSLNPHARAATSSAAGLYQFTRGTWLQTLDRHGADHGLGWAEQAIAGGRVADPAMRVQILALRNNPDAAALMAAELASDNRAALSARLGREPDAAELYLAHFLGIGGAGELLAAIAGNPGQSAPALLSQAAAANRSIFYTPSGAPRSVAGVMEVIRHKVGAAMEGPPSFPSSSGEGGEGWGPNENPVFAAMPQPASSPEGGGLAQAAPPSSPRRPSMAETLRDAFGLGGADAKAAPAFVHAAYGRLRTFGL